MSQSTWQKVCSKSDLVPGGGVCVLLGQQQVALFFETTNQQVYAVSNLDPIQQVESVSRGLMGGLADQVYVATPLLKHRYELATGQSLDGAEQYLCCWPARILHHSVEVLSEPIPVTEVNHE